MWMLLRSSKGLWSLSRGRSHWAQYYTYHILATSSLPIIMATRQQCLSPRGWWDGLLARQGESRLSDMSLSNRPNGHPFILFSQRSVIFDKVRKVNKSVPRSHVTDHRRLDISQAYPLISCAIWWQILEFFVRLLWWMVLCIWLKMTEKKTSLNKTVTNGFSTFQLVWFPPTFPSRHWSRKTVRLIKIKISELKYNHSLWFSVFDRWFCTLNIVMSH